MSNICVRCGAKQSIFDSWGENGLCMPCWKENPNHTVNEQEITELRNQEAVKRTLIETILITTETVTSFKISKRIDVITSQAAFEINNFKDIVVGFMNPVKGRANEMEKQIDLLKDKAMYDLKAKAHQLNANGVVGVDLDISTVTIGQISMLMLVASGTAVVIED